jgi:proteic killer suppression protein
MDMSFDSKKVQAICMKIGKAKRELGVELAGALQRRLADLDAAITIADVPIGNLRPHNKDGSVMTMDISPTCRLTFAAAHARNPTDAKGLVDWSKVERIKILTIERHDV